MIWRDKLKPIPEPCCLVVKNGTKIISITWSLIPVPLSLTSKYSCWLAFCAMLTSMHFTDSGVFNCLRTSRALVSRFIITCSTWPLSIITNCWLCTDKLKVILSCLACCEWSATTCLARSAKICGCKCGAGKLLTFLNCAINSPKCSVRDASVVKASCRSCLSSWSSKQSSFGSSAVQVCANEESGVIELAISWVSTLVRRLYACCS